MLPKWDTDSLTQDFLIRISIRGVDRLGILNEITNYISVSLGVNIKRLNLGTEQGIFDGYIDVLVRDKSVLEDMIAHLKEVNGVQTVQRTDIV